MSPEEYQRFVEKQHLESAHAAPVAPPPRPRNQSMSWWVYTIPFFTVLLVFSTWKMTTNMPASKKSSFWDTLLGASAKATGRKYNANADSLTERFTFGK